MRIVVDLQGSQGSNRHRGIGRYGLSLLKGLARNRGRHEIFVALNELFPESVEAIRATLDGLIPFENIIVWQSLSGVHVTGLNNDSRRRAAELIRESVLASLDPDYILIASMFEGFEDDIVTSAGVLSSKTPTAVILYDLIPLINRESYLQNPILEKWYLTKIAHLRNVNLFLAISESSRREAIDYIGADINQVVNISTAAEDHFIPLPVDSAMRQHLERAYGLRRPFVLYTGGIDHRKNIDRLIEAFAALPAAITHQYQLAIVCAVHDAERLRLLELAKTAGLEPDDVIFTGYIPETDLLASYRLCTLFVFPSWHEGFGLPVLEAMKCGRAVIAANRSSLPEVVGLSEALFDPFDVNAMTAKISEVLTDEKLRRRLEKHGLEQAKKFTWDITAKRAWNSLEASLARQKIKPQFIPQDFTKKLRLAYFSPLPPEASGISDYSSELLPELARYYQIDVIVAQDYVSDAYIRANFSMRDIGWFKRHLNKFDRIIYHFGNSPFHVHMVDLLREYPGIVVLHDFFLSGLIEYRDAIGTNSNEWPRALFEAQGWPALIRRLNLDDIIQLGLAYPCNQSVLESALGVIVHANYSRMLAHEWYGEAAGKDWRVIPHLREKTFGMDRSMARRDLGIAEDEFLVCSFGLLGRMKMNDRLALAWRISALANDQRCRLVFVGSNSTDEYGLEFERTVRNINSDGRIEITGWVDTKDFRKWLVAADLGVQLRTLSRGETSGTVYDCLGVGLPTIVNANGAMAEIPADCVWQMNDAFSDDDLVEALTHLWKDESARQTLSRNGKALIAERHQPRRCAASYADAIESYYAKAMSSTHGLERALIQSDTGLTQDDWALVSNAIARNMRSDFRAPRLFVDISELVQRDSKSGIQRVVRSILAHWLRNPPRGWVVEPVYAIQDEIGYRCARRFTSEFLGVWPGWSDDEPVEPVYGDKFIGLDLQSVILPQQASILMSWRRIGVDVRVVVYDLLPMISPQFFGSAGQNYHHNWFDVISKLDGVICISRAVADEYREWLKYFGPRRTSSLKIDWFHLGGDTENSVPSKGLPENAHDALESIRKSPSFLSVGTIEPRKGQRQTLAAMETLWAKDIDVNLVLVGKLGWLMEEFAEKIRTHPLLNKRLFWLEAISDEYLDLVYAASFCLIAASEGEGFGLPLIEAARHELPILARSLPVFREIAGASATYFEDSREPMVIADAIEALIEPSSHPVPSQGIKWLTWAQSANALLEVVMGDAPPYATWRPDPVLRLWGNDIRMMSQIGDRDGQTMRTNGNAGFLVYGPYVPMKADTYRIRAWGTLTTLVGTEFLDMASSRGEARHLHVKPEVDGNRWFIDAHITLQLAIEDLEIRLWVDQGSDLSIDTIEVIPAMTSSLH